MLDYEWENPSSIMLSAGDERHHQEPHDPTRAALSVYDPTTQSYNDHRHIISPPLLSSYSNNHLTVYGHQTTHITTNQYHHSFYDPRTTSYAADSIYPTHSNYFSFDQNGTGSGGSVGSPYNFLIPKAEVDVVSRPLDFTSSNRIGLNLGGRTYFSAADDDFVSRLYRRSRPGEPGLGNSLSAPRCQAEGCNADLSHAKHYHRRHKVCEFHSKASTVVAAGLSQRFCQQCSRFHLLSEFDNGKRSCRKRLADHNRRRRKCHQPASTAHDGVKTTLDTTTNPKSPNDSGTKSSSSPPNNNGLLSPPTISLECFRQRQFQTTTPSSSTSASSSSNSMFFSSG